MKLAFFGGIYNNHIALKAAIADAHQRGAERMFCLGDLGAFGPHPDRTCELIREHEIEVVQGNYDHSIGHGLNDCQCGYTDPRDNHFAQLSYDYTLANTSDDHRAWLRSLPTAIRFEVDGLRFLLCHGSPRRTNEFLWESTTSTQFLTKLCNDFECDVILGTHTGLHWQRTWNRPAVVQASSLQLSSEREACTTPADTRRFINVGALGRPENDGTTNVWYTLLRTGNDARAGRSPLPRECSPLSPRADVWGTDVEDETRSQSERTTLRSRRERATLDVEFIPLAYDHQKLAREMIAEHLPDEFIETILTGWWTTCLEVLPSKERRRGRW